MARSLVLGAMAAALGTAAAAQPPPADWRTLAGCSAAYRVNAQLADPARTASMTAQISEVADDYAKAAAEAYLRATGVRPATARGAVAAYAARRGQALRKRPRRSVEAFIEACPQVSSD